MTVQDKTEEVDYKQKYYSTLEALSNAQSQIIFFQNQVLFKEKQNKKLSERIRRLTNGTEISDLSPIKDYEYSPYEEASEGLNSLLPTSLSGDTDSMFGYPQGTLSVVIAVFDVTMNGKPRKRARKKCRDCNQDDCKGPTSGPFGKLLCSVWVANNPDKVIKYQEKLKEMKKVG